MKKVLIAGFGLLLLFVLAIKISPALIERSERRRLIAEQEQVVLPEPEESALQPSAASSSSLPSPSLVSSSPSLLRVAVNWDVPFTSQAPFANWDGLHGEACEEASVLMVLRYFSGQKIASPDDAEKAIQHLVAANEALGFAVDDTAEEIITLLHSEDPTLPAVLLHNPSIEDLKSLLSDGSLVIVPAAGQQLGNPYFRRPGPRYHMLVLRGYTKDGYVITNDPGTKHGEQYAYKWETMMNAIHDWNGGEVESGAKVVVVVHRADKN